MSDSFVGVLESWVGIEVTVINPESYKLTALGQGLTFQAYKAKIAAIKEDYITLAFASVKKDSSTEVEQIVPYRSIKRLSTWGDEKLIHL